MDSGKYSLKCLDPKLLKVKFKYGGLLLELNNQSPSSTVSADQD